MKNSSDIFRNRTRDLLACSAVPQPTAPPRASQLLAVTPNYFFLSDAVHRDNCVNTWYEQGKGKDQPKTSHEGPEGE